VGLLLDASILIENERGRLDVEGHVRRHGEGETFLSVITVSELLHGVHRAPDGATMSRRSAWVEAVAARFALLPVDLAAARAHARLWAHLASEGRIIGPHDLWLAAVALSRGLTLVTANLREFERVPGLVAEDWSVSRAV
jgi:tRNA(fMet)-specific endonuclease VapC